MNQQFQERANSEVDRRMVLLGGMALGAFVLGGCNGAGRPTATRGSSSVVVSNGPSTANVASKPLPTPQAPRQAASVNVLPRRAWTSAGIARPSDAYAMNGINRITVHHSAVDSSGLRSQAQAAKHLESIRQAHVRNGWADIGYHYIIDPQGRVWEGRSVWKQGAHVKDENEHNLGVMLMGNFDRQQPTADALRSLQSVLVVQMRSCRVATNRVYTHQELKPSACPGRNLQTKMIAMRSRNGALVLATGDEPMFT